ncbi:SLAP domain-containing protein [Companilactobacillus insicii]|uniref:SLAP domain-containing protein n=1 Tax=Companilactobacillus insicii TaxID=1732567 RepID=UPI0013DDB727|nr:SLAP domain-containing protein [Companilactobacillus insicii]
MKKNSLLLGTAMAVLLAPGILTNVSAQNVEAASKLVGVVKRGGGTLYDANGKAIGRTVDNFTSWQLGKSTTIGGVTYYKVATNEWLRADSIEIQGATGNTNTGTTSTTEVKTSGYIGRILKGGTVSVDDNGKYTGQTFANYTAWKLSAKKTINGTTYYKVATNQWINATAMTVHDAGGTLVNEAINSTTITKTPGYIGTIQKGGTLSYDDKGNMTNNAFGNYYTSWKLDAMKVVNGITYYRVATNQWISASAMTVADSTGKVVSAADTTDPSVDTNANASSNITKTTGYIGEVLSNAGSGTNSYDDNGNPTGKFYDQYSRWKLTGTKTINGNQYYRIATHEWLLGNTIKVFDASGNQVNNSTSTSNNKVAKVNNYAEIFNDQFVSTQYVLTKDTEWNISDSKTVNGVLYYKVADNQWIKSSAVTVKTVDNTTTPTVKYVLTTTANAQIYDTSTNSFTTDKNQAGTSYNILGIVYNKNKTYFFQVGPNSWILAKYTNVKDDSVYQNAGYEPDFSLSATNAPTETPTTINNKVATVINGGTYFYNDSNNGYETSPVTGGTSWRVFKIVKNANGELFFQVGSHEWIDGSHASLNFNLSDVNIETDNNFGIAK